MTKNAPNRLPAGYTRRRLAGRIVVIALVLIITALKIQFDGPAESLPEADPVEIGSRPGADFGSVVVRTDSDEAAGAANSFDSPDTERRPHNSPDGIAPAAQTEAGTSGASLGAEGGAATVPADDAAPIRGPPGRLSLIAGTTDEFVSAAGLLYLPGSADQHRLKHVLKHAQDDLSKPIHGVFTGNRDQILTWIDLAWLEYQNKSARVRSQQQGGRTAITVDLQEKIGYVGGQRGQQKDHPPCRYLKLVVQQDNEVVTAYPVDRW